MNKKKLIIRCCIAVCCLTVLMFTILFAAGTFDPHNKYDSLKINGAAMSKLKKFCPPSDTQIIIKIPDFDLIKYMSQNDSIIDAFEAYENMRKTYLNYNEMDNYMYYYYDSATEDLKYLAISSALLSTATAEKCRLTDGDSYTPLHCRLCRIMLNAEKVLNLFLTDIKVKHTFIFRDAGGYFTIYFITNKGDYALYRIYETKFDPTLQEPIICFLQSCFFKSSEKTKIIRMFPATPLLFFPDTITAPLWTGPRNTSLNFPMSSKDLPQALPAGNTSKI